MSKQIKARSTKRKAQARTDGRDMWLAGIGAASLLRKNATKAYADASVVVAQLPEKSAEFIEVIVERANAFKVEFVNRVVPTFGRRVKSMASEGVATIESRLRPLLGKLGVKTKPAKVTKRRKIAARKAAAKRVVGRARKAA
ncbi:MAG: hypothetical protein ABIT64_03805 [Lysobacteraceae bacterium]